MGRVNTSLLSDPVYLITALRVCSHTNCDNFCFEYTHYHHIQVPIAATNQPWMSLASPSPFPGFSSSSSSSSSSASAWHSFPRMFFPTYRVPRRFVGRKDSPGLVRRTRSRLTGGHTRCRQSAFTCVGKTRKLWTEGGWHASERSTRDAKTYADTQ